MQPHFGRTPGDVGRVNQPLDRHVHEVRIAQVLGAIGERPRFSMLPQSGARWPIDLAPGRATQRSSGSEQPIMRRRMARVMHVC